MVQEVPGQRPTENPAPEVKQMGRVAVTRTIDGQERTFELIVSNLYGHEVDGTVVAAKFECVFSSDIDPTEEENFEICIALMQEALKQLREQNPPAPEAA